MPTMLNNQGDAKVEGERIVRVLKDAVNNMKIMFALQYMEKSEWVDLEYQMDHNDFRHLVAFCKRYSDMENVPGMDGIRTIEKSTSKLKIESSDMESDSDDGYDEEEVHKTMKVIMKKESYVNFLLNIYKKNKPHPFLLDLEQFSKLMEERILQTPQMEKKLDARMIHLYQENETLKEQVAALRAKVHMLRKKQKEFLVDKALILERSERLVGEIKQATKEFIEAKIAESESQMIRDWAMSERTQAELAEDLKHQAIYFENAQKDQMAKEKECRNQRSKAESQLVALIQTYDTDIGSRHEEKEQLTTSLATEREQLQAIQEQFDEQEVEYLQLMNDKEKYERDLWNEKLYQIQCKIAARKIQRAFRRYLERSKSRKRGKRGKGKGRK